MTVAKISLQVVPWDDPAFMAAFDRGRTAVEGQGLTLDDPRGQLALQSALRADGYPNAVVVGHRSVDDALEHSARCLVRRDG
jgi:hypothetical protein